MVEESFQDGCNLIVKGLLLTNRVAHLEVPRSRVRRRGIPQGMAQQFLGNAPKADSVFESIL